MSKYTSAENPRKTADYVYKFNRKKTLTFVYPDGLKTAHARMHDAGFIHKISKMEKFQKGKNV